MMTARLLLFICILFPPAAVGGASALRAHHSPYLAMHADDPVQWQPWGSGVLELARRENKPIFIASGYFSCHWCHVMQRESFRDETIAALLNSEFIPVVIDRELNPGLDATLLDFVRKTRGVAGWPLNVFITPEGYPLVGSGYQTPAEFLGVLRRLAVRWQNEGEGLSELAARAELAPTLRQAPLQEGSLRDALLQAVLQRADLLAGGFGDGAKYPDIPLLKAVLWLDGGNEELRDFVALTLRQIGSQALHDPIGGGFFRYSIDPAWQQPHFEKMLYDNAQLAHFYLQAAALLHDEAMQRLGLQTLDFILREMPHRDGGYIASLSALDGHGLEGGYYLWREEQLEAALGLAELRLFGISWRLQGGAEWVGALPLQVLDGPQLAARLNLPREEAERWLTRIRSRLLEVRQQRQLPRDEQRIAAWNGVLLSALSVAAPLAPQYAEAGRALRRHLDDYWREGALLRTAGGEVAASLEDYALVAQGLVDWWGFSGAEADRALAATLLREAVERFEAEGLWQLGDEGSVALGVPRLLFREGPLASPVVTILQLQRRLALPLPLAPTYTRLRESAGEIREAPLDYPGYIMALEGAPATAVSDGLPSPAPTDRAAAPATE